ncbi:cysteine--1-D-myo-inosityl 2-amino-2-deoxy-alpha-D-glucopyranoside ligase [Naumannella halotolerans]|uniref:L-cysteine:1D-myo-inositol 2-amino-2-deoxy-alpha-D-glucopyranoside ligase n=1 Tax=Naumannella halotolerans TaxID=993414 RepID=A0A4R7J9L9_9ACTN|nr:cysteine--1-D-myo-inosityl 2-amino-2-deoxy-alpha-D-glucopyranoside ligase [Naumannella halotolerans]TDT33069.1 L-cysteine:1D-myo-inositol 2-amino-2-deoxy-alpha-D-glucopyranoside ligase [Naumannella halotolerans]
MQAWPHPAIPSLLPDPTAGPVRIFDSLTDQVTEVGPSSGTARLYVCGITPYDATHLGHAATYVAFDLLQRQWRDVGLNVNYVQNITDVDDPLLERARATGEDWQELAAREVQLFRTDMAALNVIPPADYVGVVEAIPLITELLATYGEDAIYQLDDEYPDWYFRADRAPHLGELSKLGPEESLRLFGERGGDPDRAGKQNPLDWLVWRAARPDEPAWDSPLGPGRPGWHIECTAIANRFLGQTFDVEGGGSDLIFPHHEMSAAEAEVAFGVPFAKVYAHAGMVGYEGEKMSKSLGNLVLVSKLREAGEDPMAVRLVLLSHHWHEDWSYDDAQLQAATERLTRWREAAGRETVPEVSSVIAAVRTAMRDNLDSPSALAAIDEWAASDGEEPGAGAADLVDAIDALLGVRLGNR